MSGTITTYWQKYKAINAWFAMACYMVTLVVWGILFLDEPGQRLTIAVSAIPLGVLLDYVLHKWQTGRPNFESALITSSIVTVLMPSDIIWWIPPLAVVLAIGSKHFVLWQKKHIFNPASFGVAITALLFGYSLGWWPDSFAWITVLFGLLNVWRVKKFPQVLAFLVVYFVLLLVTVGPPTFVLSFDGLGYQTFLITLPYFFMLFILPEPVTSIQPRRQQVEFGALAAVLGFAAGFIPAIQGAALLWGLLAANLYARYRKRAPAAS